MRKAGRMLREARLRAGLGQTDLSRAAGIPARTVRRIEAGEVMPRVDTLERLLLSCGRTLSSEPRPGGPAEQGSDDLAINVSKALYFLRGQAVRHVVVGDLGARLRGARVRVGGVEILVPDESGLRTRLVSVLRLLNRPFSRVKLEVAHVKTDRFDEIRRAATLLGPVPTPVACLDDLIDLAKDEGRRVTPVLLREQLDQG